MTLDLDKVTIYGADIQILTYIKTMSIDDLTSQDVDNEAVSIEKRIDLNRIEVQKSNSGW